MKKWYNYLIRLGVIAFLLFFFSIVVGVMSIGFQTSIPVINRQVITFRIDRDFTVKEVREIKVALYEWEVASNHYFHFEMCIETINFGEMFRWKSDGMPTIYKATSIFSWKSFIGRMLTGPTKHIVGMTMIYTGDIFIYTSDIRNLLFRKIIIHEVGHVITGSWHSYDPNSVMYPILFDPTNAVIQKLDVKLAIDFVKCFDEEIKKIGE